MGAPCAVQWEEAVAFPPIPGTNAIMTKRNTAETIGGNQLKKELIRYLSKKILYLPAGSCQVQIRETFRDSFDDNGLKMIR
jgi:hypothetical protein